MFKIGDKVKVVKCSYRNTPIKFVGLEGVILKVLACDDSREVLFELFLDADCFLAYETELVVNTFFKATDYETV